jgi:hypothetical protein
MATQRDPQSDLSPRKVAERLKEEGKERLERGKSTAADQVDQVANALRTAGDELGGQSAFGNYANQFAGSIGRLGRRLRDSSIEDLASDMQMAARRNPAMFVLGGLALGIVLARLVKASTPESHAYESDFDDDFDELSGGEASASSGNQTFQGGSSGAGTSSLEGASDRNSVVGSSRNPSGV